MRYNIQSEDKYGSDSSINKGKWRLIWFILLNKWKKGIYSKREKINITVHR
jgi:hypothetical protein